MGVAVGLWLAVGIVLATIGNLLREPLCVGGGSECSGARPPAHGFGNVLYFVGTGLAFASPIVVAAILALRRSHQR